MPGDGDNSAIRLDLRRKTIAEVVREDDLLKGCPLLKAAGEESSALLSGSVARRFGAGRPVYQEGDAGDSLFLVLRGEVRLNARNGRALVEVATVRKAEVFGESEVVGAGGKRALSALALSDVELIEVPRKLVIELSARAPDLMDHLLELEGQRRAARDEMSAFLSKW